MTRVKAEETTEIMVIRRGQVVTFRCVCGCRWRDQADGPDCVHPDDETWKPPVKGRTCPNYTSKEE